MGTDTLKLSKRVYKSEDEFNELKGSWDTLTQIAGSDVFQLHEWQYSWWEVFGENNELHIVTYWLEDELIAILPFFIQNKTISRFRFSRTLQLIGSHLTTAKGGILPVDKAFGGYLDIIVNPDHISSVQNEMADLFRELLQIVDQILLDEIPQRSLLVQFGSDNAISSDWTFDHSKASSCSHCLIDSDWDLYLSTLSRSTRKNIRRGLRSLYDDHIFEIKQSADIHEFELMFDELVRLHQDRWHRFDQPGIFADPRLRDLYKKTALRLFQSGNADIYWAEKEGKVIAVELIYKYNHTIYAVQNGFDDNSEFSKYSPSNVILYHIMKTGIENGYLVFDWLRGTESYKSSTSNLVIRNQRLTFSARRQLSGLRISLTNFLTNLLTKSKNERLVLSVYNENYSFRDFLKNYTRRLLDQTSVLSK